jgi:hypothetical protein
LLKYRWDFTSRPYEKSRSNPRSSSYWDKIEDGDTEKSILYWYLYSGGPAFLLTWNLVKSHLYFNNKAFIDPKNCVYCKKLIKPRQVRGALQRFFGRGVLDTTLYNKFVSNLWQETWDHQNGLSLFLMLHSTTRHSFKIRRVMSSVQRRFIFLLKKIRHALW